MKSSHCVLRSLIIFHFIKADATAVAMRQPFWHESYDDNCRNMEIKITMAIQKYYCSFCHERIHFTAVVERALLLFAYKLTVIKKSEKNENEKRTT